MQPENNVQSEPSVPVNNNTGGDVVFKDKPKKNLGVIFGMVFLAILAAGGIGFGVWAMMDGNSQKEQLNEQISVLRTQNNELMDKLENSNIEESTKIDVDTDSDSWRVFSDNLAKDYSGSVFGNYYSSSSNETQSMMANVDKNHHLQIIDTANDGQVVAELDDVISVYFIRIGNGGVPYFYIINKDGDVFRINISENTDSRVIEKVDEYRNIVSVIEGGDLYAWLIDINGNLYKTY